MQFHFEPNLPHQREAVSAVVNIFEGAPHTPPEGRFGGDDVSGNILALPSRHWHENAREIAAKNAVSEPSWCENNDFTVEMETGTGKTYVYLRAIFELHRRYGVHKFFIVVPTVAVREGVLAQLRLTRQHFSELYATQAVVIEYDSKKLPQVRSFCLSSHLSIMVMNKQAFDSDRNIINDEERDSGNFLELIQKVRPIIVMDEPQEGMDTENMQKRLAAFHPLFKLRFSATHRHPRNIVYQLSPIEAYNHGLVKKIAVLSVHEVNTQSNVAITLTRVKLNGGREPTASLKLNHRLKSGDFKSKSSMVKRGDDLERKTSNPIYRGWIIEDIGTTDLYDGEGYIHFTNGEKLNEGCEHGSDKETIFRDQIKRAIRAHFQHKQRVLPLGIKPLALFFIDRVANYTNEDGMIRRLFTEEYAALYQETYHQPAGDIAAVHNGYFAQSQSGEFTDSKRSMATNREIYDKILRDKEALLAPEEPLEFLFSHSALGVGWDNPNVFTICTLNETESMIKKRQEIGRGLRLCVTQNGTRYRDGESTPENGEINLLTVVVNQSYYSFVTTYQQELNEELGAGAKIPPIRDLNRKTVTLRRNERHFHSEDFRSLWQLIAQKTQCRVHFDENRLVERCTESLDTIVVDENRLEVSLYYWDRLHEKGQVTDRARGSARTRVSGTIPPLNIVEELARDTALSEYTAASVLTGLSHDAKRQIVKNPMQFLGLAARRVKAIMADEMVRLVRYDTTGATHPFTLLAQTVETRMPSVETPNRGLYDGLVYESDIEKRFAGDIDGQDMVRLFLKLPREYKIPMPFGGSYTPDFALVIQKNDLDSGDESRFYFTVETKGTTEFDQLKQEEKWKIRCAIKHFEAIGLKTYLAPVTDLRSFDDRARERIGETFFHR